MSMDVFVFSDNLRAANEKFPGHITLHGMEQRISLFSMEFSKGNPVFYIF